LVGLIDSSELLKLDAQHSLWPLELGDAGRGDAEPGSQNGAAGASGGDEEASMLWVDEITCVGCKFCSSVARGTFLMTAQVG
jgi:NAD-dependent dihydropyrimidine dehydrogenase PreA subunit